MGQQSSLFPSPKFPPDVAHEAFRVADTVRRRQLEVARRKVIREREVSGSIESDDGTRCVGKVVDMLRIAGVRSEDRKSATSTL